LRGHLWVYRNELAETPDAEDGEIVDLLSAQGRFVGRGFYQAQGGIAVRLLSRKPVRIDAEFLTDRIAAARRFRERIFPNETVYRWVFGESDGIPGLVADRYGSVVSGQTSCRFYGPYVDQLATAFLSCDGVSGARMEVSGEVHRYGAVPGRVECVVDGVRVTVDVDAGQKTGMFLDQRTNWRAAGAYAREARVLDGHCYIGLWSLHAALAGATHVTAVDTSAQAIEAARRNAEINGVADRCAFEHADIAAVLQRGERYDLVILDPPAFAKSHAQAFKARGVYQTLNCSAIKVIEAGGVLVSSSCSHFVTLDEFLEILKRAATAAQRQVWILDIRGAAPDHPVLMAMPETQYLKCVTLRML